MNDKQITARGFGYYTFQSSHGDECILQKSSAIGDYIWLGPKTLKVEHFKAGQGWNTVVYPEHTIEEHYVGNERMHLNRQQVAELIPLLQKFVDTGEI